MSFTHVRTSEEAIHFLSDQIKSLNTKVIISIALKYNQLHGSVVSELSTLVAEMVSMTEQYKNFIMKSDRNVTVVGQLSRTEFALKKIESIKVRILLQRLKVEEELKKMASRASFVEAESKKYVKLVKQFDTIKQPSVEQKGINISGLYRCVVELKNAIGETFSVAKETKAEVEEKVKLCEKQFEDSLSFVRDNARNQNLIRERAHSILKLRDKGNPALSSSSFSIHHHSHGKKKRKREEKSHSLRTKAPKRP